MLLEHFLLAIVFPPDRFYVFFSFVVHCVKLFESFEINFKSSFQFLFSMTDINCFLVNSIQKTLPKSRFTLEFSVIARCVKKHSSTFSRYLFYEFSCCVCWLSTIVFKIFEDLGFSFTFPMPDIVFFFSCEFNQTKLTWPKSRSGLKIVDVCTSCFCWTKFGILF